MIKGIGCDIVEKKIAEYLGWDKNESTQKAIFTKNEILEFRKRKSIKYLMGRFAVKEAVVKCLGTGFVDGLTPLNIETLQELNGKPKLSLNGKVLKISKDLGFQCLLVSISHSKNYSIAIVVGESLE